MEKVGFLHTTEKLTKGEQSQVVLPVKVGMVFCLTKSCKQSQSVCLDN